MTTTTTGIVRVHTYRPSYLLWPALFSLLRLAEGEDPPTTHRQDNVDLTRRVRGRTAGE